MQVLKQEIHKKILIAARDLFLAKGYKASSMKQMADACEISVSNIYNYFPGKRQLFAVLVLPLIQSLEGGLLPTMERQEHETDDLTHILEALVPPLCDIVSAKHREMVLLFDCSMGSGYEGYREKFVTSVASHFQEGLSLEVSQGSRLFYHIIANNLVEGILEVARHYKDPATTEEMISSLMRYHLNGIQVFL